MFDPFGWTKGRPHKHELTNFYPKLDLRRVLLALSLSMYIDIFI